MINAMRFSELRLFGFVIHSSNNDAMHHFSYAALIMYKRCLFYNNSPISIIPIYKARFAERFVKMSCRYRRIDLHYAMIRIMHGENRIYELQNKHGSNLSRNKLRNKLFFFFFQKNILHSLKVLSKIFRLQYY